MGAMENKRLLESLGGMTLCQILYPLMIVSWVKHIMSVSSAKSKKVFG